MSRLLSVTICALLLLMSYGSSIQTSVNHSMELEDPPVVKPTSGSQQQIGAFNGSIPPIEDLHTIPLNLDYSSCMMYSTTSTTPHFQDYVQAEDGSYFVLGSATSNGILMNGNSILDESGILMHFDQDGTCLNAEGYSMRVSSDNSSFNTLSSIMNYWHAYGAHTLILLDEDWLVVAGTLGYESYQYSSWGGVVNSSSISGTSTAGEHFFVAKIARSNFSIADWKIIPAWDSGLTGSGPCNRIGVYPQTFSNNTEFAVAIDLKCAAFASNSRVHMEISGTTYQSLYCSNNLACVDSSILVRFDHNLTVIESAEIPTPHWSDANINFLKSGVVVTLTGTGPTDSDVVAHYRIPGQQWFEIDLDLNFPASSTSIFTLDEERFGWLITTPYTTGPQDVILYIVNTTSGNTTQHVLGSISSSAPETTWFLGGGFALNSHRILQSLGMGSDSFTTPSGLVGYGSITIHYDINTQNLTFTPISTVFKFPVANEPLRASGTITADTVDVFIGSSIIFQTIVQSIQILEIDQDNDDTPDRIDAFPFDETQQIDSDSDGYGDDSTGNNPDDCPYLSGNSTADLLGCPDNDGDGYSNQGDLFQNDATQVSDFDADGYGDNLTGTFGDVCPSTYGESTRDRYGCPDADFDGWSDENDTFPNDSSQWTDWDGDGYGDQLIGFQGDACPQTVGNSTEDRYGCPDADGDGWSDDGDDMPSNPTQWKDRDGDGYGDNSTGTMADLFPSDGTQWNDTDGDNHGDNPYGNEGDWFPDDPSRWADSDRDGFADEDDAFANDATQWNDTDGDGYGDEETGNRGDAFPEDPAEWQDSDSDGIGNNADAFPFDPSQQTDSDGDGFGDNPLGSGADKFPDDISQWSDIDGDGFGDNQTGTDADVFIADPTQHADRDGDGFGDSLSGRLADQFPDNPTQWIDQDGDGLGDNQSGTDADPYLFDFDNDGYNDSIDILPKLSSPGDHDNDGCLDEVDAFPLDYRECSDFDGDGDGDNADTDDDNDGWTDTDEIREDTDPFDASDYPIEVFQLMIPGTTIGLDGWDLIGIFGGVPLFAWILFGFVTRNKRCRKYEDMLKGAQTKKELENVALKSEYSLMIRLLGPHQGIRLERLRAELDDALAGEAHHVPEILEPEDITEDQTHIVEDEMVAGTVFSGPSKDASGQIGSDGYEWTEYEGTNYYRTPNSGADWQTWKN